MNTIAKETGFTYKENKLKDGYKVMNYIIRLIYGLIIIMCFYSNAWTQNVIIAHPDCPFVKASSLEIRKIYLGELTKWKGKCDIEPVNQTPDKDIRKVFLFRFLKMSNTEYTAYWAKQQQLPRIKPLKEFKSSAEVVEFVSHNKNAIGYVEAFSANDNVKIVFINGSEVW